MTKKRHPVARATFAETVREVKAGPAPLSPMTPVESVIDRDWFHGPGGVVWQRRGDAILRGMPLAKLVMDSGVEVLHEYMGKRTVIPVEERKTFWADAENSMAQSSFSDFYGAEFKSEDHVHLVVVHEDC